MKNYIIYPYCRLHVSTKEVIGDESAGDKSADDDERQQIKAVKKKSHILMVVYIRSKYQLTVTHLATYLVGTGNVAG